MKLTKDFDEHDKVDDVDSDWEDECTALTKENIDAISSKLRQTKSKIPKIKS